MPLALDTVMILAVREFENAIFASGPGIMEDAANGVIGMIENYKESEVSDVYYISQAIRMFVELKGMSGISACHLISD